MWMRSCAICKALMKKLRLSDSVPVSAGGNGRAIRIETPALQARKQHAGILRREGRANCGKSNRVLHTDQLPKSVKWGSPEQRGKIIEFAPQVKKSA
jgi:hypothetical protein